MKIVKPMKCYTMETKTDKLKPYDSIEIKKIPHPQMTKPVYPTAQPGGEAAGSQAIKRKPIDSSKKS